MENNLIINILPITGESGISLVSISPDDAELLRIWKNSNREFFSHKSLINKDEQDQWIKEYFSDTDNSMFKIMYDDKIIGCLGFRKRTDGADIYNVILGRKNLKGKGLMSTALLLLVSYITTLKIDRIYLKVLISNENAIQWYQKNNFTIIEEFKDVFLMECNSDHLDLIGLKTIRTGV